MKTGRVFHCFSAKDGRKVILRTPKWEDLDDLLELINSLVEENADIGYDTKISREEEIDWLAGAISRLEKEESLYMVAEVDGKVVASSGITKRRFHCESHVGDLGILIKSDTEMLESALK